MSFNVKFPYCIQFGRVVFFFHFLSHFIWILWTCDVSVLRSTFWIAAWHILDRSIAHFVSQHGTFWIAAWHILDRSMAHFGSQHGTFLDRSMAHFGSQHGTFWIAVWHILDGSITNIGFKTATKDRLVWTRRKKPLYVRQLFLNLQPSIWFFFHSFVSLSWEKSPRNRFGTLRLCSVNNVE